MRPLRTFLFLLTVVLTLSLLSVFLKPIKWTAGLNLSGKPDSVSVTSDSSFSFTSVITKDSSVSDTSGGLLSEPDTNADTAHFLYRPGEAVADTLIKGGQYRIMFYGDSQLEGDRMTSMMRSRLCLIGGGTGIGMFSPVMPVMYTRSFIVRSSSNWKRYTWLDYKHGRLSENKFGPLLSLCRYSEPGGKSSRPLSAWVSVKPAPTADSVAAIYDNIRIFYGNITDTVDIKVYSGGMPVSAGKLLPATGVTEYSCPLPGTKSEVRVEFEGRVSPDIYAMSLESSGGIVVDNIPLRGSAGLEFVMTNETAFSQSMDLLKPDLLILQYGLNVVRNVRRDYTFYEEGLVRQIEYLKKVSGKTNLLLVSVTDMADTQGDSIIYFSNIPAIRDAQKRAAARTGILFWDAWDAMGGEGSVIRWADQKPSLVMNDLTHLSLAGADTITLKMLADIFSTKTVKVSPESIPDERSSLFLCHGASESISDAGNVIPSERPVTFAGTMMTRVAQFLSYDPGSSFIFTSKPFWIFLLIVLLGFSVVAKHKSMRNGWLLFVSLWFYYKAGGLFFILLLFTSVVNFFAGLIISSSSKKKVRKLALCISIITGLGLLGYFKYAVFLTETVNALLKTSFVTHDFLSSWSNAFLGTGFDISTIILPVGISFFTFQALSYTIDIYRNKVAPVKSFIDFSFYVAFFPHLVAGPIVRASEFVPQMYREFSLSKNEWSHALFLILQGLIKKMIISDFIAAGLIDRIFTNPALFSGFENLLAVYGYGIQIYCDFSGYTDIAIGVAMLMGFRLPVNFNAPYKASSISDFWKRWHISLSRWLKDYLYIPMGGNRGGKLRTGFNIMITMLLGGLWHGASLRFIIWGGLHGIALIINKIWKDVFKQRIGGRLARAAGIIVTFHFVSFAWIFFRTDSTADAMIMLGRIFSAFDPGSYKAVILAYLPSLLIALAGYILHFVPSTIKESYRGLFIKMPLGVKFIAIVVVCIVIYKVGSDVTQPFIYFRF